MINFKRFFIILTVRLVGILINKEPGTKILLYHHLALLCDSTMCETNSEEYALRKRKQQLINLTSIE